MGIFTPSTKTILSVYPGQLQPHESKHHGVTRYTIPPADPNRIIVRFPQPLNAPKGYAQKPDEIKQCNPGEGYSLLRVYDTEQWVRDYNNERQDAVIPMPISAETIAQGLVNMHTAIAGNKSEGGIGVMVIAGDEPTEEELKACRRQQNLLFAFLIKEANDMFANGRSADIREQHRVAARGMGNTTYPWYAAVKQEAFKKCPACARDILAAALRCEHCHVNLVEFYREMGIEPTQEQDPAVFRAFQMKQQQVAKAFAASAIPQAAPKAAEQPRR